MTKISKKVEIKAKIEDEAKQLLYVLSKRAGLEPSEILEAMAKKWIKENLDLLTKAEKERFKNVIYGR